VDDDVIQVSTTRTAGGLVRNGDGTEPAVYLELTGQSVAGPPGPTTVRFSLPLDAYFALMALLEHAGKTALLMGA
jgi:hypothetical protein